MINLSILDEGVDELVELRTENANLKKELKEKEEALKWYHDAMHGKAFDNMSCSDKLDDLYVMFYGDTPLCDYCDANTGFFLTIDKIYDFLKSHRLLCRLLRLF